MELTVQDLNPHASRVATIHHCKDFHFPSSSQTFAFTTSMIFDTAPAYAWSHLPCTLNIIPLSIFICFILPHLYSYPADFTSLPYLHHLHLSPLDLHESFLHCFSQCIHVFSMVIISMSSANRTICSTYKTLLHFYSNLIYKRNWAKIKIRLHSDTSLYFLVLWYLMHILSKCLSHI